MNLKILFMLLIYYTIIALVLGFGVSVFADKGYTSTIDLNDSDIASSEIDTGGLFGSGVSVGRFITLVTFGIGLPSDTPNWFQIMFISWQTLVTIFTVGFIISSIWNG